MKTTIIFSLIFLLSTGTNLLAQTNALGSFPISSATSYTGNSVNNVHGGLRNGSAYLGLLTWEMEASLPHLPVPGNGVFHLNFANTHGGEPSSVFVGDFQGVSNIEAGTHSFLYELWYKHSIHDYSVTVGLQDMNSEFANSEYAALFQNSSFGIHSTIAGNISSPIYPVTAFGISASALVTEGTILKLGVYDGSPNDFSSNEYNIDWHVSHESGYTGIAEIEQAFSLNPEMNGILKLGTYFSHSDEYARMNPGSNVENYGMYAVIEHDIRNNADGAGKLTVFSQFGYTPGNATINKLYYSIGLHQSAPVSSRPDDIVGLALASAVLQGENRITETAVELAYQATIFEHFFVKPNVQYIINPAGTEDVLPDAVVASVQFGFNF